jgi:hypothetical protein
VINPEPHGVKMNGCGDVCAHGPELSVPAVAGGAAAEEEAGGNPPLRLKERAGRVRAGGNAERAGGKGRAGLRKPVIEVTLIFFYETRPGAGPANQTSRSTKTSAPATRSISTVTMHFVNSPAGMKLMETLAERWKTKQAITLRLFR